MDSIIWCICAVAVAILAAVWGRQNEKLKAERAKLLALIEAADADRNSASIVLRSTTANFGEHVGTNYGPDGPGQPKYGRRENGCYIPPEKLPNIPDLEEQLVLAQQRIEFLEYNGFGIQQDVLRQQREEQAKSATLDKSRAMPVMSESAPVLNQTASESPAPPPGWPAFDPTWTPERIEPEAASQQS
ncbi:MAG: hypothetical protein U0Q18_37035 [Bryobacteraceae bacterium]